MSMLEVNDLHVYYGSIHAVKGVSFTVDKGEIVTLIGANGAGKSTTLNTIAGILPARRGSVEFQGEGILGVPAHKMVRKGIALCPEGRRVFTQMTVEENLQMGGYTRTDAENADTMEDVYGHFPRLRERAYQVAGTLSGGEQQRVSICRALAKNPKILLCDEPTGALDSETGVVVLKLLLKMARDHGKTIIIVTHNQNIAKMADVVIHIRSGKVTSVEEQPHPLAAEEVDW